MCSLKVLKIDLINRCNAACPFCPYHAARVHQAPLSRLSITDVQGIVLGCRRLGITPQFKFSGRGEATVHPDFPEMVRLASAEGFQTRLITNGLLLRTHASVLAECGTDVVVSIHGNEATHDAVIGKRGALCLAEAGIEAVAARGASVTVGIILTPDTIEDLEEIGARYASQEKVRVRVHHNFDTHVRESLSPHAVQAALARLKERFPNIRTVPHVPEELLDRYYSTNGFVLQPHACTHFIEEVEISSDGMVSVCGAAPFGNIRNEPFEHLVASNSRTSFMATIAGELRSADGLAATRCDRCCYQ
ncbi:MAG: radical SAM protein [Candidatus Paceibacterota bacterium]|jgi:MoaA/NifB/PqqE/SkfB family radical SAM enzyme